MNDNLIVWQKWADPFGLDDTDTNGHTHDPYLGDYQDNDMLDDDEDSSEAHGMQANPAQQIKVIATPMGIIPITDNTVSSKIFNFWVGHTNFDITSNVADTIEQTDGVETLDIFTRYRFRIAIGKVFDDSSVMREINSRVYAELARNVN